MEKTTQIPRDGAETSHGNLPRRRWEHRKKKRVDISGVVYYSDNEQYRHWIIMTSTTTSNDEKYAFVSVDAEGRHLRRPTTIIGVIDLSVSGNAEG